MINERVNTFSNFIYALLCSADTFFMFFAILRTCAIVMVYIIFEFKSTAKLEWLNFFKVNMLRDRQLRNRGLIPSREKGFWYFLKRPARPWGPPNIVCTGCQELFSLGTMCCVKATVRLHIVARLRTYLLDRSTIAKLIALEITD